MVICALLAGCAVEPSGGPPPGSLKDARLACDAQYSRRIGNYLPHARCVNEAVERYAVPTARYPDLVRLQAAARIKFSDRIDRRAISPGTGTQRMGRIDALVAAAERDRNAGKESAARYNIAAIEALLR
jgi:hypothetical protein